MNLVNYRCALMSLVSCCCMCLVSLALLLIKNLVNLELLMGPGKSRRFFDANPISRIMSHFSGDVTIIDDVSINSSFGHFLSGSDSGHYTVAIQ